MSTAVALPPLAAPAERKRPAAAGEPTAVRQPPATASASPERALRRFSVNEYHRLVRDGFFRPDERCELIRGLIVEQMPRDPIHDAVLEIVLELLHARVPAGWRVRPQMAVTTADSQPEPDAAVVRGRPQDNFGHHPTPADTALAVEVSNSSLGGDRGVKASLYAEVNVPTYWIVNVRDRRVEVYSDPTGPDSEPAYRRREDYPDGTFVPLVIDGIACETVPVLELFPPRS